MDKLDAEFAFGRQALDVRAYRQALLSSNIANADTPGYQARDVDFSSALSAALKQSGAPGMTRGGTPPLALAQPEGITSANPQAGDMNGHAMLTQTGGFADNDGQLAYRMPQLPSMDGNTVELDTERVQFADNALHYESQMTEVSNDIKTMISAITSGS
jgi:flagellar basal-body rod protein FlgB